VTWQCLAEIIQQVRHAEQTVDGAHISSAYQARRHSDQRGTSAATDLLIRLFTNPLGPVRHLRNAALITADLLPGARKLIARAGMGLLGRQTRLARGVRYER